MTTDQIMSMLPGFLLPGPSLLPCSARSLTIYWNGELNGLNEGISVGGESERSWGDLRIQVMVVDGDPASP